MSLPSNGSLALSEINRSVRFTNGNVGIGTTAPNSKLHLYHSSELALNLQSSTAQTQLWSFSDTKSYFQSSGDIEFTGVGSTTLRHLYLATTGNVGIGTETPRIGLHVEGNSVLGNSDGDIIGGNLYWNGSAWTRINNNVTGFGLRIGSTSNGNGMQIVTMDTANGFANRMLVGANGNVGIGTTNPAQRLEVAGGRVRVSQSGFASAVYEMRNSAGIGYLFNNPAGSVHLFPVGNRNLILGADESGITGGSVGIATSNPTSFANLHVNGDILLSPNNSLWITGIGDNASNRLRVHYDASFGISFIDFMGGALLFRGGSSLNNLMVLNTNGNLSLGTNNTPERLTVNGTTDIYGMLRIGSNATSASYTINLGTTGVGGFRSGFIFGDGTNMLISNQQPGFLRFNTDNDDSKCFIIASSGNVSIGTTQERGKLHINSGSIFPNIALTTDDIYINALDFDSTNKTNGKFWRVMSTHQSASEGQGRFIIQNVTDGRTGFSIAPNGATAIGTMFPANLGLHITNGTTGQFQLGPSDWRGVHMEVASGNMGFYSGTWGAGTYLGGWHAGGLTVVGALSKGSGSFDIQHPLHPDDSSKRLVHSFIEGPRCDLIYRGQVTLTNGTATVNLDTDCVADQDCGMSLGTFEALCANPQFHLENENFSRVIGNLQGNILTIECEDTTSTDIVYWTVIAERKDTFIKSWERTNTNGYLVTEYTKTVVQE